MQSYKIIPYYYTKINLSATNSLHISVVFNILLF